MNKKEVQQRVSLNGKPIPMSMFAWDEKTNTFSSNVDGLVIDFIGVSGCTFNTGSDCTFNTGYGCTFNTGYGCMFNTGSDCTFNTGNRCTFNTGSDCTFKTGYGCVIVRRDEFAVIQPLENEEIKLCPYETPGYISKRKGEEYFMMDTPEGRIPHIIVDGILSRIVKQKGNVYHVINYGEENQTYLVNDGDKWAHGSTLKEARESLLYKIGNRDTSKYKDMTTDTVLSIGDAIEMYRVITGACEGGVRGFMATITDRKKEYSIAEIIELTTGRYGNDTLINFFKHNG